MKTKPRKQKENNDIYRTLAPLYIITVIFGLSPFIYRREYKHSYILIIYSYLVIAGFIGFYYAFVHRSRSLNNTSIISAIDVIHVYYYNILSVMIILYSSRYSQQLIQVIKQITDLDTKFKKQDFIVSLRYITKWILTGYIILLFIITGYLEYANCSYTLRENFPFSIYCWLYCFFCIMISALMECQFLILVFILKQRFGALNSYLANLKPQFIQTRNIIKDIQNYHTELCGILRDVNSIFSLQLLFYVGMIFLKSTLNLVHVFQEIKMDNFGFDTVTSVIWAAYYVLRLFILCQICTKTMNEVNTTGSLLHITEVHYKDEDTTTSVLMFSKQMLHNKLILNAYGFFPLDMTLFFTIVAAVTMYLLIMVQMDTFFKDDTNNNTATTVLPFNDILNVSMIYEQQDGQY